MVEGVDEEQQKKLFRRIKAENRREKIDFELAKKIWEEEKISMEKGKKKVSDCANDSERGLPLKKRRTSGEYNSQFAAHAADDIITQDGLVFSQCNDDDEEDASTKLQSQGKREAPNNTVQISLGATTAAEDEDYKTTNGSGGDPYELEFNGETMETVDRGKVEEQEYILQQIQKRKEQIEEDKSLCLKILQLDNKELAARMRKRKQQEERNNASRLKLLSNE